MEIMRTYNILDEFKPVPNHQTILNTPHGKFWILMAGVGAKPLWDKCDYACIVATPNKDATQYIYWHHWTFPCVKGTVTVFMERVKAYLTASREFPQPEHLEAIYMELLLPLIVP